MSPKLDERISSLEAKLKQLKVRQQRIDARARAITSRRARKDDTRRKILIGATVLARIDAQQMDHTELTAGSTPTSPALTIAHSSTCRRRKQWPHRPSPRVHDRRAER